MQVLTLLYQATGLVTALFYIPQVLALWRDDSGARAVSLLTWSAWSVASLATLLYAALVLRNPPFVVNAAVNCVGCATVLLLAAWRRRRPHPGATARAGA